MKKRFLILAMAAFLMTGCVSTYTWEPVCRHDVVYVASVVGEHHPVRFVIGDVTGVKDKLHVEAQAFIDEEWQYIKLDAGKISTIKRASSSFLPTYVWSWNEYTTWLDKHILEPARWR